jgi:glycosyltransferase involved in cell wall biosynthesis
MKMDNLTIPLISVIIPTYNTAKYLIETLECALNQSWANKEIILVNDGSTDNTLSLLKPYMAKINYIYQENRGLGAARNTGLKAAKGDFVVFLDADDLLSPNFLEVMLKSIRERPGVDILYCWWSFIDESGHLLPEPGRYTGQGDLFQAYVISNRFPVMAALTPKYCIDCAGGFDENKLISEDWDFWLRVSQKGYKFDFLSEVLVYYRFHGSNMTLNIERSHQRYTAVLDKLYLSKHLPDKIMELKPTAYSQIFLTKALYYTSQGEYTKALVPLKEAVQIWPELICQKETYYRLACAEQPPGYRDTSWFRDLPKMEKQINGWLESIFTEPALVEQLTGYKKTARAKRDIALAELYYQSGKGAKARQLLLQAVVILPAEIRNQQSVNLLIRSVLGKNLILKLKRLKAWQQKPSLVSLERL